MHQALRSIGCSLQAWQHQSVAHGRHPPCQTAPSTKNEAAKAWWANTGLPCPVVPLWHALCCCCMLLWGPPGSRKRVSDPHSFRTEFQLPGLSSRRLSFCPPCSLLMRVLPCLAKEHATGIPVQATCLTALSAGLGQKGVAPNRTVKQFVNSAT